MNDGLPFPLSGSTLVTGPSNVGKTRLTARALDEWVSAHSPDAVVVFEFGPEYEHGGRILGRRLSRFTDIPDEVCYSVLDARAPRAESTSERELLQLARENATGAERLLDRAPQSPVAVFVNDTTIGFQHEESDVSRLVAYCDRARCSVLNAFESDELGTDDPVSRQEHATLASLKACTDRTVTLGTD
ncbi:hypothetical protein [Halogranum rubrum]|uniref:Uncharacterized protein n=1 Tax=Halogranum salarium B-1 TaxID=1210908 RepID=J3JDN9_9EURY|nr:hypothetical protein [Halogranum salarium]EJN57654.1 hypothetical protein HSB1_40150 [Halogranum salarium B-1]